MCELLSPQPLPQPYLGKKDHLLGRFTLVPTSRSVWPVSSFKNGTHVEWLEWPCPWIRATQFLRSGRFFLRPLQDGGRLLVLRQYSNWNSPLEKFQEKIDVKIKNEWNESMTSHEPATSNTGVIMYCHYTSRSFGCQHTHFILCLFAPFY